MSRYFTTVLVLRNSNSDGRMDRAADGGSLSIRQRTEILTTDRDRIYGDEFREQVELLGNDPDSRLARTQKRTHPKAEIGEQCGIKRAFKATSDTAFSRFVPATHEDTETHRGRDIAMAQPLFNRANVDAVLDPLGCTKMS